MAVLINCHEHQRNQLLITIWRQLLVIWKRQKLTAIIESFCIGLTMFENLIYLTGLLLISMRQNIVAFQPVTENNHVLVGHVFQQLYATDWFRCLQACHDEPRCISYNYERSAGANGLCELNDRGVEDLCDRNKSLIYSLGFVFQQIRQSKVSTVSVKLAWSWFLACAILCSGVFLVSSDVLYPHMHSAYFIKMSSIVCAILKTQFISMMKST